MNIEIKVVINDKKKLDLKLNIIFSVSFSIIGEEIWRDNFELLINLMEVISLDKIVESYKEFYYNEWFVVYKVLQKIGMIVMEEEIVKKLSIILYVSFCLFCVVIIKVVDRFFYKIILGYFYCIINLYWYILIYVFMFIIKEIMI